MISSLPHSFRVWYQVFSTRLECGFKSSPLSSSVVPSLPHSFRVWFSGQYVWFRDLDLCKFELGQVVDLGTLNDYTIEKGMLVEPGKIHSKRVEFFPDSRADFLLIFNPCSLTYLWVLLDDVLFDFLKYYDVAVYDFKGSEEKMRILEGVVGGRKI